MPSVYFQNAVVLNHTGQIADSLRIERDKITAIHSAPKREDFAVDLEGRIILPGFINAHDHLAMNNFGKIKYRDIYPNAHDWSLDIEARFNCDPAIIAPRQARIADRLFHGAIKNLLAGVTTVCHHDPWHRSLDMHDFPVRVVKRFGYCHSLQRGGDIARSFRRAPQGAPWIIHLAEGTDQASAGELDTLIELDCLQETTIIVHGVGLTREQRQVAVARGGALVWCPSSNFFLLGKTAEISEFKQRRRVALGTDSLLTGAGNMWDELKVAYSTHQAAPHELVRFITRDAADILRLTNLGEIQVGAQADLLILPAPQTEPARDLLQFSRVDMQLVLIGGKPRYGDLAMVDVFSHTNVATEKIRLDGKPKLLARNIARRLKHSSINEEGIEL